MSEYLGGILQIKTKDGIFEGVLVDIDMGTKKFTLNKVKVLSSGKRIRTPLHFYGNEVLELKVMDTTNGKSQPNDSATTQDTPTNQSHTLERVENKETSSQAKPRVEKAGNTSPLMNGWHEEHKRTTSSSKGYIVINKIDSDFIKVMQHLKQQRFIGLAFGGINIGRRGDLHIVQVNADDLTYIFDVKCLGTALFNHGKGGLAEVLESHSIVKVMHDCRWVSDLLHNKYGINLNCIYDTQVADVFVRRQEKGGEIPRDARPLAQCLLEYLEISISEVYNKMLNKNLEMDKEIWEERPLNPDLLDSAMRDVHYLLDLRVATLRRLMGEFMCATHIYLTSVRDTADSRGTKGQDPSIIPYGVMDLLRGGYRGRSIYEDFQFGAVGDGDATEKTNNGDAVPWDLWQAGQKLSPSLHKSPCMPEAATTAKPPERLLTGHTDNQGETSLTNPSTIASSIAFENNSKPAGAEEESDSDNEDDVFGEDETGYDWRRQPTVECDDDKDKSAKPRPFVAAAATTRNSTAVPQRLTDHVDEPFRSTSEISNNNNVAKKDQDLYRVPTVKCATDLYNLPVSAVDSTSTSTEDDEVRDSVAKEEEEDDDAPIQWPTVEQSQSSYNISSRPAGMERGTFYEALSSGNDKSPLRQMKTAPESVLPSQNINPAVREDSPLSIPDLDDGEQDAFHDADEETVRSSSTQYHVNSEGATVQVKSQTSSVESDMPFVPLQSSVRDTETAQDSPGAFYLSPKVPIKNCTKKPDQMRYRPPRMRNLPPRFQKAQQHQTLPTTHQAMSNGVAESGSESTSSGSSSGGSGSARSGSPSVGATTRTNQTPLSYGEMMATLSDPNRGRDSPPSDHEEDEMESGGEEATNASAAFGSHLIQAAGSDTTASSGNEDNVMSRYEDRIAARTMSSTCGIGRGRARTLETSRDQLPMRRRPRDRTMHTLNGNEVKMDYPSEYEIHHAPKAVPIRANSHLLSMKVLGRGGRY